MENKYYTPNNLENEIWADVKGFEEIYQISNLGRVKRKPFILKVCKDKDNYPKVTLSDPNEIWSMSVKHFVYHGEIKSINQFRKINKWLKI